jgi:lipid-binding SYLF domain-containing protein
MPDASKECHKPIAEFELRGNNRKDCLLRTRNTGGDNQMEATMKGVLRGSVLIVLTSLMLACASTPSTTNEPIVQQLLVDEARVVVDIFASDPDMAWFRKYLKDAKGVLILPDLYKGAWFLGGSGGRGVLVVRDQETGKWAGPAFCSMGSVSFGLQFGGQKSEAIVLVMTEKGVKSLQKTSVKLGGDASVAAGPVGIGAQGATAPSLNVDYITFARCMGAFIGVSLDGAVIDENYDWNKAYYGRPVRPADILVGHGATNPNAAKLCSAVTKASLTQQ